MPKSVKPTHIDRWLAGQPIKLGERTVQPVARVTGWSGTAGDRVGGAWLRARPVEVLVTDRDGNTFRVPITVDKNDTYRWLALAGLMVLPLNWLLRRTLRRRHVS
jgi:hypothetical protein